MVSFNPLLHFSISCIEYLSHFWEEWAEQDASRLKEAASSYVPSLLAKHLPSPKKPDIFWQSVNGMQCLSTTSNKATEGKKKPHMTVAPLNGQRCLFLACLLELVDIFSSKCCFPPIKKMMFRQKIRSSAKIIFSVLGSRQKNKPPALKRNSIFWCQNGEGGGESVFCIFLTKKRIWKKMQSLGFRQIFDRGEKQSVRKQLGWAVSSHFSFSYCFSFQSVSSSKIAKEQHLPTVPSALMFTPS